MICQMMYKLPVQRGIMLHYSISLKFSMAAVFLGCNNKQIMVAEDVALQHNACLGLISRMTVSDKMKAPGSS